MRARSGRPRPVIAEGSAAGAVEAGATWKQDGGFVFTSKFGYRMMPEEPIRELKIALKLAELPDIRFHDLRHSTAIILQALGVDLKTIHKSWKRTAIKTATKTFYRISTRVLPGFDQSIVQFAAGQWLF